ncbi:P-type ATPase (P-ATPase) Superfamily, partial [Phytophthora palmivora]
MGVAVGVADSELTSVTLYTPLPWPMRLDLLPFLFLYSTAVYLYTIRPEDDEVPWIFGALSVFCHALALLSAEWSVDVRCWMTCARLAAVVEDERLKMLVKVEPSLTMLPKLLCDCHLGPKEKKSKTKVPTLWFSFQNLKFCLYEDVETINRSETQFRRLDFPSNDTLESYVQSQGIRSTEDLQHARGKWGKNDFELPMPKFAELLKEQLVAPFFVFQFFCMLLWCLDEYMYYSLLTLLMLVVFECESVPLRKEAVGASIVNDTEKLKNLEIDDGTSMKHKRH